VEMQHSLMKLLAGFSSLLLCCPPRAQLRKVANLQFWGIFLN
jgi:hypothetical protein